MAAGIAGVIRLTRFLARKTVVIRLRAGSAAQGNARRKKIAQAVILRQQLLAVMGEINIIGPGLHVIRFRLPLSIHFDFIIATGASRGHRQIY
jgi:hypothetical protein